MAVETNVNHALVVLTSRFGHAAPAYALSASISQNAPWEAEKYQEDLRKAAYLMGQAAELLERVEKAMDADRMAVLAR